MEKHYHRDDSIRLLYRIAITSISCSKQRNMGLLWRCEDGCQNESDYPLPVKQIEEAAARHELSDYGQIGVLHACTEELDYIRMLQLRHQIDFCFKFLQLHGRGTMKDWKQTQLGFCTCLVQLVLAHSCQLCQLRI